ncbi:MAG: hypothetical protein K0S32_1931 [Bacteroidetes bacterium]|nr:hypothetical protein [Bacteroidota bacterium]
MEKQTFSNHVRRHPLYHFFIVPLSLLLIGAAIFNVVHDANLASLSLLISTVFIHILAFLTRDYAKKNQDRIIRAELRLRYLTLTGKSFEEKEKQLTVPQLLALRFASDHEFIEFLERKNLSTLDAMNIKKQIKNWQPDTMRV